MLLESRKHKGSNLKVVKSFHLWMKKATEKKKAPLLKEKNPDLVKLGLRIRNLRFEKGYTSYEYFAYEHGFHRAQFGRYESGKDDMKFSTLLKIAKAFDMTVPELLGGQF